MLRRVEGNDHVGCLRQDLVQDRVDEAAGRIKVDLSSRSVPAFHLREVGPLQTRTVTHRHLRCTVTESELAYLIGRPRRVEVDQFGVRGHPVRKDHVFGTVGKAAGIEPVQIQRTSTLANDHLSVYGVAVAHRIRVAHRDGLGADEVTVVVEIAVDDHLMRFAPPWAVAVAFGDHGKIRARNRLADILLLDGAGSGVFTGKQFQAGHGVAGFVELHLDETGPSAGASSRTAIRILRCATGVDREQMILAVVDIDRTATGGSDALESVLNVAENLVGRSRTLDRSPRHVGDLAGGNTTGGIEIRVKFGKLESVRSARDRRAGRNHSRGSCPLGQNRRGRAWQLVDGCHRDSRTSHGNGLTGGFLQHAQGVGSSDGSVVVDIATSLRAGVDTDR